MTSSLNKYNFFLCIEYNQKLWKLDTYTYNIINIDFNIDINVSNKYWLDISHFFIS